MKKIIIFLMLVVLNINPSYASEQLVKAKPCSKTSLGKIKNNLECKAVGKFYRWVEIIEPKKEPAKTNNASTTVSLPKKEKADTSGINLNFIISDNALKRNYEQYTAALSDSVEFWYPVFNKANVNVILFTEHDSVWIDQKQKELMGNFFYRPEYDFQSYRLKQYGCNIGGFYLPNIILACVRDSQMNDLEAYMLLPHEYVHLVGMTSLQLSSIPLGNVGRLRPCWVEEGMATFYGMKSASNVDKNFIANKADILDRMERLRITTNTKSYQSIFNTMKDLEQNMTTCSKVQDAYFLGFLAFEKLYNEYGHNKILDFNKLFFSGTHWKTAFYSSFGLNVDEFYDKLAKEVVKP